MKLVAVSVVRDELDIVEPFVRHAAALVDEVIVTDHGSTDGTREVLAELARELPLTVRDDDAPGLRQAQRMTRMMREAVENRGADWVIPLDADEFPIGLWRETLAQSDASAPLEARWRTYVPDPADDPEELNPALRLRHRLAAEANPWAKVAVPAALVRAGSSLAQGSHELLAQGRKVEARLAPELRLAHLPVRSVGQYAAKVALAQLATLVTPGRAPSWNLHLRAAYELLKSEPAAFPAALRAAALGYALSPGQQFEPRLELDPLAYQGGPIKHGGSPDDLGRALRVVLGWAEQLARKYDAGQ